MFDAADLINAFRASGSWIDEGAMAIAPVDGMGMGAIAKRDIEAHSPLFHIPPSYLLTPWTSSLRNHLSEAQWDSLEGGWARLILCMMWEESRAESPWAGYLRNMPREFDSPMFWSTEDREALKGTDIEDRIGREDAEAEYNTKLAPLIASRADLFSSGNFTLNDFHVQGSRILSRSFTIPISRAGGPAPPADEGQDDDDLDEEEEVAVMVPMADMLNAAYERDNARLFADGDDDDSDDEDEEEKKKSIAAAKRFGEGYTMITTKPVKAGEQIYNTYASPPNSELLRKYGHVDVLPLPAHILSLLSPDEVGEYAFGNAGDEVEIAGDLIVSAAVTAGYLPADGADGAAARVDWWLDEGQADAFSVCYPSEAAITAIPPAMWAFARLLTRDEDWQRAKKGKLPKPKDDDDASRAIILAALRERAARYPQTLLVDLESVKSDNLNARNAAAVRIGEKRVLSIAVRAVQALIDEPASAKRKAEERDGSSKRRK